METETEEYKGIKYKILPDELTDSPRGWDNLGKVICFHKEYNLGDKHNLKFDNFSGWDELKAYLKKEEKAINIIPLFLYAHSGITIKAGSSFKDRWDSGQVGFIYTTKEFIKKMGVKKANIEEALYAEVEVYNKYLTGEVYYFVIEEPVNDSCGGFFGYAEAKSEVKERIDVYLSPIAEAKRDAEALNEMENQLIKVK